MKINLDEIDRDNFIVREGEVAGETVYLVFPPHIGTKWNKRNLHFRSSVWNSEGQLISASYPKFFNWGEQPDLGHTPFSTTANGGISILEKRDGSTLIVSRYKGEFIIRTRGTLDAGIMENSAELEIFKQNHPKVFDETYPTWSNSLIFEWESPDNIIVINHTEPRIVLTNVINHNDYSLTPQNELDDVAKRLGVERPKRYKYSKIKELIDDVKSWQGVEGVCVYSQRDQSIRKIKSEWYLALHRMKSELGSFGRVVDLFFTLDMPEYKSFYEMVEEQYDFEIAQRIMPSMSIICDGWKKVAEIVNGMEMFVENKLRNISAQGGHKAIRKEQAKLIFDSYGKTNRAGYLFSILDGRDLGKDEYKKLLYQIVKEPEEKDDEE